MKKNIKKSILNAKSYQPGKPIEEVKRELGLKSVVKLASNETPYGPSPKVLKAIEKGARNINRYPDGNCFYLRKELARRLKVAENQFIFGNGSDEIIVLAVRAFVGEGDEVVVARPSFLIYEIASKIAGAKIKAVPLRNFYYDIEGMLKAVTKKTKIVFIGNPDNPGGTFVPAGQLEKFLSEIRKDILVFIDEAYYEYVLSKDYPDSIKLLKKYKNIIVARTFSKMYGLAGLRIGYGIASPEIIDILNRLREPFNVNSLAQDAALACLKDQAYYRRLAKDIEQQRQFLYKQIRDLGLEFAESVTNFILINVRKKSSVIVNRLLRKGVIVRDMSVWGLDTYIRVTIGKVEENRRFINSLKEIL